MHGIEIRQFTHSAEIKRETPFCTRKRSETYKICTSSNVILKIVANVWMSNNAWYEHCGFGNGNNPDESVLLEWTQIIVSWMNIVPIDGSPEETNGLKV